MHRNQWLSYTSQQGIEGGMDIIHNRLKINKTTKKNLTKEVEKLSEKKLKKTVDFKNPPILMDCQN